VNSVGIRHLEEPFSQKLRRPMTDHAITLHFSETETTVSGRKMSIRENEKRKKARQKFEKSQILLFK
jgi:hypothetical protein